jgi:hypothetical protein
VITVTVSAPGISDPVTLTVPEELFVCDLAAAAAKRFALIPAPYGLESGGAPLYAKGSLRENEIHDGDQLLLVDPTKPDFGASGLQAA